MMPSMKKIMSWMGQYTPLMKTNLHRCTDSGRQHQVELHHLPEPDLEVGRIALRSR